jgi:hypothetical protein
MYQHHTQCSLHCTGPYQSRHLSRVIPHIVRVDGCPSHNLIEENKLFLTQLSLQPKQGWVYCPSIILRKELSGLGVRQPCMPTSPSFPNRFTPLVDDILRNAQSPTSYFEGHS